jgi:hypothetical protein
LTGVQPLHRHLDAAQRTNKICYVRRHRALDNRDSWKGETAMSQPFSRFLHPFDVAHHPSLEPEVKRAILASWASDQFAVRNEPALRKPPSAKCAVPIDDILAAMRDLDRGEEPIPSRQ